MVESTTDIEPNPLEDLKRVRAYLTEEWKKIFTLERAYEPEEEKKLRALGRAMDLIDEAIESLTSDVYMP